MRFEVIIPPVKPVKEYVLTLDEREARALCSVCGRIAGKPQGPRGFIESIYDALRGAGVPWDSARRYFKGTLTGADEWPEEEK